MPVKAIVFGAPTRMTIGYIVLEYVPIQLPAYEMPVIKIHIRSVRRYLFKDENIVINAIAVHDQTQAAVY